VTGECRKLHNEDFHDLLLFSKYNENDRVRDLAMGRAYSTHEYRQVMSTGYYREGRKERDN
jgi:hypothetical protein